MCACLGAGAGRPRQDGKGPGGRLRWVPAGGSRAPHRLPHGGVVRGAIGARGQQGDMQATLRRGGDGSQARHAGKHGGQCRGRGAFNGPADETRAALQRAEPRRREPGGGGRGANLQDPPSAVGCR